MISLIVTIIVLIILAGISINIILGEDGILIKAKQASKLSEIARIKDNVQMDLSALQIEKEGQNLKITQNDIESILKKYGTINKNMNGSIKSLTPLGKNYEIEYSDLYKEGVISTYNETKKVNEPQLLVGMTPIKFEMPTENKIGQTIETNSSDENWYEYGITYETKRWANARTEDGSMWVWIPRYAYKINNNTNIIDIVFLIGTTDNYYKEDGTIGIAQKMTEIENVPNTTESEYIVHPAFTNESNIEYINGGWDKEISRNMGSKI